MPTNQDIKQKVTEVFDLVADGYDHPSLRFFPSCADALIHFIRPQPGSKILDVATGTGVAAVAAARTIGSSGRVQAIDLAEDMIEKAIMNVEKMALNNVDFHVMDAEQVEFKSNYFDAVMCSFGIFFLPDMQAALTNWLRVLKPGGQVAFTIFGETALRPMAEIFRAQMEQYGVEFDKTAWEKLNQKQHCEQLLDKAGATDIRVLEKQMGYHLDNADDWWAVIWNSGFRAYIEQLSPEQLAEFRIQHLQEVSKLATDKGLWMDVNVLFASGQKPANIE